MLVFSILDKKAKKFSVPQIVNSEIDIIRALEIGLKQENQTLYSQFPEDFALYRIGKFNEDDGILECINPEFILDLNTLKK